MTDTVLRLRDANISFCGARQTIHIITAVRRLSPAGTNGIKKSGGRQAPALRCETYRYKISKGVLLSEIRITWSFCDFVAEILYSPPKLAKRISLGASRITLQSNRTRRQANITEKPLAKASGFSCIAPPKKILLENPYGIRDFSVFYVFFATSARFKQNHRNYFLSAKKDITLF